MVENHYPVVRRQDVSFLLGFKIFALDNGREFPPTVLALGKFLIKMREIGDVLPFIPPLRGFHKSFPFNSCPDAMHERAITFVHNRCHRYGNGWSGEDRFRCVGLVSELSSTNCSQQSAPPSYQGKPTTFNFLL